MTFAEKISKILDANTLQIHSVSQLEDYIKAGRSSIGAHVAKNAKPNSAPGRATQKKIIEKLRINQDWWDHGKGDMFIKSEVRNGVSIPSEDHPPTLLQILLESVRGVNKLVDANNGLVDKLDKDKNWALTELEKLHAKLGVSK